MISSFPTTWMIASHIAIARVKDRLYADLLQILKPPLPKQ